MFGAGQTALVGERLELFAFATAPDRVIYLWVLRAFERAKQRYDVRLGPSAVAAELDALRAEHAEVPHPSNLAGSLDALVGWGVLDRSQDAGRARTLAEYRQRSSIYELTELGWLAFQAVEGVLGARPDEAELRRLVFTAVLEDLRGLADAARARDAEQVNIKLDRIHNALEDLTRRASRFHLALGELMRTQETRPEVFLEHKDRLLVHLREFLQALQQHRPLLAAAVRDVEAVGVDTVCDLAAAADGPVASTRAERTELWRARWRGIAAWFVGGATPSTCERLDAGTALAIRELAALLRRVTEARHRGVSRATQLELLAEWFAAAPSDAHAHALFRAAFALPAPRHLSVMHPDPDLVRPGERWSVAPPVPVSTTLRAYGRQVGSPGRPAPLPERRAARRLARERQDAARLASRTAQATLAASPLGDRVLTRPELAVLLRLVSRALEARVPVSADLTGPLSDVRLDRLRLRLTPSPTDTLVRTEDGLLVLTGVALDVQPVPAS